MALLAVNTPDNWKLGTVGKVLEDVTIRIAEDGEILAKGPNVFSGYYRDEEATREAFTEDGFFKTGDIGELDEEGYLKITDRKKNLIVTASGKNIAPLPIEERFKRNLYVSQAVMFGDSRPFTVILICPDFEALTSWATGIGITWIDRADLCHRNRVVRLFDQVLQEVNGNLARYQQPKKYALIPDEFTVDNGLLTPTQKVRRREVARRYGDVIDRLYARDGS